MTKPSDREYYERRLREERALEAASSDEAIARTHAKLAAGYAEKLAKLDAGGPSPATG